MAKVIPIRDFSKNGIMLTVFGGWLNDRTRVTFEEKTDAETNACVAGVRRFAYFIKPVPLCESTLAESRAFRAELRGPRTTVDETYVGARSRYSSPTACIEAALKRRRQIIRPVGSHHVRRISSRDSEKRSALTPG